MPIVIFLGDNRYKFSLLTTLIISQDPLDKSDFDRPTFDHIINLAHHCCPLQKFKLCHLWSIMLDTYLLSSLSKPRTDQARRLGRRRRRASIVFVNHRLQSPGRLQLHRARRVSVGSLRRFRREVQRRTRALHLLRSPSVRRSERARGTCWSAFKPFK